MTYVFCESVPFSGINALQPNSPLLGQPGLNPFLVCPFILQRNDRRHALPFAFSGRDPESALECRGDEKLMDEADFVTLGYVVRGRGDRGE